MSSSVTEAETTSTSTTTTTTVTSTTTTTSSRPATASADATTDESPIATSGDLPIVVSTSVTSLKTSTTVSAIASTTTAVGGTTESGGGSGLGIGLGVAAVVLLLAVGAFFWFKKRSSKNDGDRVAERGVSITELAPKSPPSPSSELPSPSSGVPTPAVSRAGTYAPIVQQTPVPTPIEEVVVVAAAAAATTVIATETVSAEAVTAAAVPVPASVAQSSILFVYDTDYSPSAPVCEEVELALQSRLQNINSRRFGIQDLPEEIELAQLGSFDRIVLVLRKAERFRIYREGKIFARLEELVGDKLNTVVFDVIMQNGNMDAQRHDGFPLIYVSTADKKIIQTAQNDATLNEIASQLLSRASPASGTTIPIDPTTAAQEPSDPIVLPEAPTEDSLTDQVIGTTKTVAAIPTSVKPISGSVSTITNDSNGNNGISSGSTVGLALGISLAMVALGVGLFYYFFRGIQKKGGDGEDESSITELRPNPYSMDSPVTPVYKKAPVVPYSMYSSGSVVSTASAVNGVSRSRSILFIYDTDYTPSGQVCQEIEYALWAKLASQQRLVATRRYGIEGLPEQIQIQELGAFDHAVLVLRKAERFRIYREGKIFARLDELVGDKLSTVVFDVILQNGNMDGQRHDGFPLLYVSSADKKLIQAPVNDSTLNELTFQLLKWMELSGCLLPTENLKFSSIQYCVPSVNLFINEYCQNDPNCSSSGVTCVGNQYCFTLQHFAGPKTKENKACIENLQRRLTTSLTTATTTTTTTTTAVSDPTGSPPPPANDPNTAIGSIPTIDTVNGGVGTTRSSAKPMTITNSASPITTSVSTSIASTNESASSGSSSTGLGIGIAVLALVAAFASGFFVYRRKQNACERQQHHYEREDDIDASSAVEFKRKTSAKSSDVPGFVAGPAVTPVVVIAPVPITPAPVSSAPIASAPVVTTGGLAVVGLATTASKPSSILFMYDTDYSPSAQVCQEVEHVIWAKLAARQRIVTTARYGIQGLPEEIELAQLGSFDRIVLVLRKAERFRIYREGKIYERLEELVGSKLSTIVFDVIMQNGNMDAQKHDGFPLIYMSSAEKKIISAPVNEFTLNEMSNLLTPSERYAQQTTVHPFNGSLWVVKAKTTPRGIRISAFASVRPAVEYAGELKQRSRTERFKVEALDPESAASLRAVVKVQSGGVVQDIGVSLVQQRTPVSLEDNTVAAIGVILANEEQFLATALGERSTAGQNKNIFNPFASEDQWDGTVENKTYEKKPTDPFVVAENDRLANNNSSNNSQNNNNGSGFAQNGKGDNNANSGNGNNGPSTNGSNNGNNAAGGLNASGNPSSTTINYAEPDGPPPPKVDDGYNDVPDAYGPGGEPSVPQPIYDADGNVVGMTSGGPRKWNQYGLKNLDHNIIAIGFPSSGISTVLNNIVGSTKFPVGSNGHPTRWTPGPVSVMTAAGREIHKFVVRQDYIEEDIQDIVEKLGLWYRAKVIVVATMDLQFNSEPYKRLLKMVKRNFGDNGLTKQIGVLFNKVRPANNAMSSFRDAIFDGDESPFFAVDINPEFAKSSTASLRVRVPGLAGFLDKLQELQLIDPNARNMPNFDPMVERVANVQQLQQANKNQDQSAAAAAEAERLRVKPNEVLLKYYWPVDRCIKYTGPSPTSSGNEGADFWFGNMSVIEWPEQGVDYDLRDTRSGTGSGVDRFEKILDNQVQSLKGKAGVDMFDAVKVIALKGKLESELRELYQTEATSNQIVTRLLLEVNPKKVKLRPEIRQLFYDVLSQGSGQMSSNNIWGQPMETRRIEFTKLLGHVGEYFPTKMVIGGRFQFFKKAKTEKKEDKTADKQGAETEIDLKGDEKKKKNKTVLLAEKGKEELDAEEDLTTDVENDESWEIQALTVPVNQAVVFGSDTTSAIAALTVLAKYKVPYVAYTAAQSSAFTTVPLFVGSTANFSMVIYGGSNSLTAAQLQQIYTYQDATGARVVSLFDQPGIGNALGYTASATTSVSTVSPANVIASTNAGLPASYSVSISGFNPLPGSVLNLTAVTPVLNFTGTAIAASVVYNFSPTRQQLSLFYQIAAWDTAGISATSNEILISWVSKGTYGYVVPPVLAGPPNQAVLFGNDTPSAASIINGLQSYKIPYISYTAAQSIAFATLPLTTATQANFSMIFLGSGTIGFTAAQWTQLYSYQDKYNVRLVSLYDVPGTGSSATYTSGSTSASGIFTVTPVSTSTIGSTSAGYPASFSISLNTVNYGGVYPAKVVNTTAVSPVLSFKSSTNVVSIAAVVYNFTSTRQQLSTFYQVAGWDTGASLSTYTNDVAISWVSRGLYSKVPAPVVPHTAQVQARALVLSPDSSSAEYPLTTLNAYGLQYDTIVIPAPGTFTPLNLEVTANSTGRYNLIILTVGQMFPQGSGYLSQLYAYQQFYGVRLVAINDVPTAPAYIGKVAAYKALTSCSTAALNLVPSSATFTGPAGLKSTWSLAAGDGIVGGSCNFPAIINDPLTVTPVLDFKAGTVANGVSAAVIDFGRNQQQMSFFLPCGAWSIACTTIGNIWFQWGTRGTYTGLRRIYFTPQIDDVFLNTDGNDENGKAVAFRISPADIQGLINWMPDINSRLPAGSNITIEMAYNGNGVMEYLSNLPTDPNYFVDIDPDMTDTGLDWQKPLGTGQTLWTPALLAGLTTTWTKTVLAQDPIYNFFSAPGNLTSVSSKFLWCSHTFTHEILNNNTYGDTSNEVNFNFHLASKSLWGLDGQPFWSNKTMVTPGISGLFNGDALKALWDFGITGAVGDSSREKTLNPIRPMWWPLTTNVSTNGFAGFTVVPRQSLNIYFNATNGPYNAKLYNNIYKTTKTFTDILGLEVSRNMRTLPLLSWQPAMFHQANLRNADMPSVTIGTKTGKLSLMQQWVESVFGSFAKVSNWPILTVKQDVLTQKFINRQIYETANVVVTQAVNVTATGVTSSGLSVSASKNCIAPVTLPRSVAIADITSLPAGATTEQIGTVDSVTVWVPLTANATPVIISFAVKTI
ncbi:UNVERIFIED_CONTAM: hypothetical protein HDU68_010621 [Siphonaria sp. JEL0065]|nr:hypothetical protein HDU68_010621 [Siphonaria sp. JEL0065]